jgi:hypothetical protein
MKIIDRVIDRQNLFWAWEKVKFAIRSGDVWYDEYAVSNFELNISNELDRIIDSIKVGNYRLEEIKPVGYPKTGLDDKSNPRTRQMFEVSIRDQLVWVAVVNIIGPIIDEEMPFWNYGNRLYIPTFIEEDKEHGKSVKFGWYRNTAGFLYRKWEQSWPRFRRNITITVKQMTKKKLDDSELEDVRINSRIDGNAFKHLRCKYIDNDYWDGNSAEKVFWASVDFEKFYPTSNILSVKQNLIAYLVDQGIEESFRTLIDALCDFKVDLTGWSAEECMSIGLSINDDRYGNIPTGLFVAGFLANVLLLEIDNQLAIKLEQNRKIAHFRFVDDHVVLSSDFEELVKWITDYKLMLKEFNTGAKINEDKTEPECLKDVWDKENQGSSDRAKDGCELDPDFPSPLMTETLAKISAINKTDFEMLSESEKDRFTDDVEHLLLADFNNQEIKKDTRLSFAATVLAKIIPLRVIQSEEMVEIEKHITNCGLEIRKHRKNGGIDKIPKEENRLEDLHAKLNNEEQKVNKVYDKLYRKVEKLLKKVINENPDKMRLWRRIVEFSLGTGHSVTKEVFDLVDRLESGKKISSLSAEYIRAYLIQLYSELACSAIVMLESQRYSSIQKNRAGEFLIDLINNYFGQTKFLFSLKPYAQKSKRLHQDTLEIIRFSIINSESKGVIQVREKLGSYDSVLSKIWDQGRKANAVWTFCKKLCHGSTIPVFLQHIFARFSPQRGYPHSLLTLFPKYLNPAVFDRLPKNLLTRALVCEVLINKEKLEEHDFYLANKFNVKGEMLKGNTLIGWMKFLLEIEKGGFSSMNERNSFYYDPRTSEWTMLEIVKQIAEKIKVKRESFEYAASNQEKKHIKYIHPLNYIFPAEWKIEQSDLSWAKWGAIMSMYKMKFNNEEMFICDERYSPQDPDIYNVIDELSNDNSLLQGLGILLVGLLSRDFSTPLFWNSRDHQKVWENMIFAKVEKLPLSSLTRQIILSIFSKRNRETHILMGMNRNPNYIEFREDTLYDPIPLLSLEDFIKRVSLSQGILAKHRLTVQDNKPRQLIPVSLKQLTREFNPYEDNEN